MDTIPREADRTRPAEPLVVVLVAADEPPEVEDAHWLSELLAVAS